MASTLATLEDLLDGPLTPGQACAQMSRLLAPRLGDERFVSLVYAVLDPARGTLTYANAGHPAPLLLAADGQVQRLAAGGPVLGVVADVAYAEATLALGPGDRLVLFTDGIVEAEGAADELGDERVLDLLRGLGASRAQETSAALLDLARSFAGGALADDATVVVVDRTGATNEVP
jgi:sigma-B regulation protein RsbU (phosphoserine phosphatase)